MSQESLNEEVVRQLHETDDWLLRGLAIRELTRFGDGAVPHLERLFELTFDEKAPVRSDACALIKRLGAAAVPFLVRCLDSPRADFRERAIQLLMESGFRTCSSVRLVEQILPLRNSELPNWGSDPTLMIKRFKECLADEDRRVRFAAASALEDFGLELVDTVEVFVDVLLNGNDEERNWAALRLGRIGVSTKCVCDAFCLKEGADSRYTSLAIAKAREQIGCPVE